MRRRANIALESNGLRRHTPCPLQKATLRIDLRVPAGVIVKSPAPSCQQGCKSASHAASTFHGIPPQQMQVRSATPCCAFTRQKKRRIKGRAKTCSTSMATFVPAQRVHMWCKILPETRSSKTKRRERRPGERPCSSSHWSPITCYRTQCVGQQFREV